MSNELSGNVLGSVIQARDIAQVVLQLGADRSGPLKQALLPPVPFVNRHPVHAAIDTAWARTRAVGKPMLVALWGPGGIGTTGAAAEWASRNENLFPDGVVYIKLSDPERVEREAAGEALGSALVALGVPAGELRATAEERAADLRSLCNNKKALLLLDDMLTAAQVRWFIPNAAGCAVVVTSRWLPQRLHADGFRLIEVPRLAEEHAHELLTGLLANEEIALPEAAESVIVRACYGFPSAIKLMSSSLAGKSPQSRERIIARIAAKGWSALDSTSRASLVEHLDFAYERLAPEATSAYRVLSVHPGAEFSRQVAVRALAWDEDDVAEALEELTTAGLLTMVGDNRFRFHDLAKEHARGLAGVPTVQVIGRMAGWYLQCAIAFDKVLSGRPRINPLYKVVPDPEHPDRAESLRWLETERVNLTGIVIAADDAGYFELVWQLCEALWGLYHLHGHYDDWITTHKLGLSAARRTKNSLAVMRISSQLGSAYLGVGELDDADRCFEESFVFARKEKHKQGEQSALEWRGKIRLRRGEPLAALELFDKSALVPVKDEDRPRVDAVLNLQRGRAYLALPNPSAAHDAFGKAREFFDTTKESDNRAKCRLGLGRALFALGELDRAREVLIEAEGLFAADGSLRSQAVTLRVLGDPESLRRAEEIYGRLGSSNL